MSERRRLRGALMVCGTTSDAGKSTLVAGLCRLLARRGVSVAPFKAQNMALNSVVTASGHEIGRAQGFQAFAAGVPADMAMNPILLKPTSDRTSQVVVNGRPWAVMSAAEYHAAKPDLLPLVLDALADLRSRYDVVLLEGAGSPTEINLLDHDIVNLRIAHEADLPAIVVGDINLGGVFAALYGTVALLPDHLRARVRGFLINKLRGDPALLLDGCEQLTARAGVPVLGVIPWLATTGLDAEDSMALDRAHTMHSDALADELDVAVVRFPRISNFTDIDPLAVEPGVRIRYVHDRAGLGDPDLVVLPGSKATVDDLAWLRRTGLAAEISRRSTTVLGICGGYQMMGATIDDRVESRAGVVEGLRWLPVRTVFGPDKVTRQRSGMAMGAAVHGYQIHHGRVVADGGEPFVTLLDDFGHGVDGVFEGDRYGTTLHGVLDADEPRRLFLAGVAARRGKRFIGAGRSFAQVRLDALDEIADALDANVDMPAIERLIASASVIADRRAGAGR
ncbi:MAG: cobyric acid synthase CobQ [Ilumatobacteraceae bacterium]|nr:cobyric acid synthase CobQ [Ilumatobacteraceae bacterium]